MTTIGKSPHEQAQAARQCGISMALRMPAEWERQRAVMLTWPDSETDWKPYLAETVATYVELARAVAAREEVVIAVRNPSSVAATLAEAFGSSPYYGRVRIYQADINDTWTRDHGPISLLKSDGKVLLKDFRFNGWGKKFAWQLDNAITRRLHAQGAFAGAELQSEDTFVLEGGSIESDGEGTLFTTRGCLLAPRRNQPLNEPAIEAELRRRLAVSRVAWIDGLQLAGDDTDGHIDTIVRLAPDHTILYIDDSRLTASADGHKPLRQQLEDAVGRLSAEFPHSHRPKPYRLIPLPMPHPIFDKEGLPLPATYANFLVVNGAVIMPSYRQPDTDRLAAVVVGQAFPGREVVQIDATPIIRQHGSLHCITMQLY